MPNDVSVEITERTFSEDEGERLVLSGLVHSGSPQTFNIILLEFHFESSFEFDEETNNYGTSAQLSVEGYTIFTYLKSWDIGESAEDGSGKTQVFPGSLRKVKKWLNTTMDEQPLYDLLISYLTVNESDKLPSSKDFDCQVSDFEEIEEIESEGESEEGEEEEEEQDSQGEEREESEEEIGIVELTAKSSEVSLKDLSSDSEGEKQVLSEDEELPAKRRKIDTSSSCLVM